MCLCWCCGCCLLSPELPAAQRLPEPTGKDIKPRKGQRDLTETCELVPLYWSLVRPAWCQNWTRPSGAKKAGTGCLVTLSGHSVLLCSTCVFLSSPVFQSVLLLCLATCVFLTDVDFLHNTRVSICKYRSLLNLLFSEVFFPISNCPLFHREFLFVYVICCFVYVVFITLQLEVFVSLYCILGKKSSETGLC